jgi:hypothetical protein
MVDVGLGVADGIGVAEADDLGIVVGIGAAVCQVVRPGGGVGVGDPEGGGLGPSALAGEARSHAPSPIAKVVVTSPRRDNLVRLPKQPHLPVAGMRDGRPRTRAQLIEKLAKTSRSS